MAVTVDVLNSQSGNLSSFSISHTFTGTNRHAVVLASRATTGSISSITGAGVSWSETVLVTESGETLHLWEPDAEPDSGAQTIAGTFAAMAHSTVTVISFAGVDQTTPSENLQTNQGSAQTVTSIVMGSAVDDMGVDGVHTETTISVGPANQIQQLNGSQAGHRHGVSTEIGASPTVAMSWTFASSIVMHAGLNLRASAAPTTALVDPIMGPGIIPFPR